MTTLLLVGQIGAFVNGTEEQQERILVEVLDPLGANSSGQSYNPAVRDLEEELLPFEVASLQSRIFELLAAESAE